jgi:hypothetical protein
MAESAQRPDSESFQASIEEKTCIRSPFDELPTELVARIFTVGAEDIPTGYWYYGNRGRRLCAFGETVSTVCRRWYAVMRARSNAQLWHAWVLYSGGGNTPETALVSFLAALARSEGADLYVVVNVNIWYTSVDDRTDTWFTEQHALAIALRMLEKYSRQLVYITVFWDTPHIAYLSLRWLKSIGDCPRLHSLRMIRGINTSSSHDALPQVQNHHVALGYLEALYSIYGDWSSDPTRGLQSRKLLFDPGLREDGLEVAPSYKFLTVGPTLETLKLWNWTSATSPCSWDAFVQLLKCCPLLTHLAVDLRHVDLLNVDFTARLRTAPATSLSRLRRMKIMGPPRAALTLLTQYTYPHLFQLSLGVVTGDPLDPDSPDSTGYKLKIPSLRCLKYFSQSQHGQPFLYMLADNPRIHEHVRLHISPYERAWRIHLDNLPAGSDETKHEDQPANPLPSPTVYEVVYGGQHEHVERPYGLTWIDLSRTRSFQTRLEARLSSESETAGVSVSAPSMTSIIVRGCPSGMDWDNWSSFLILVQSFVAPKLETAVLAKGSNLPIEETERVRISFSNSAPDQDLPMAQSLTLSWGNSLYISSPDPILEHGILSQLITLNLIIHSPSNSRGDYDCGFTPFEVLKHIALINNKDSEESAPKAVFPVLKEVHVDYRSAADEGTISRMEDHLREVRDNRMQGARPLLAITLTINRQTRSLLSR